MDQVVQIVGALLILAAFAGVQTGRWPPRALHTLLLNLIGALILSGVAASNRDWGFLMLEGVWSVVSLAGLIGLVRTRRTPPLG